MNKALTECFLTLLPATHQQDYVEVLTREPTRRFEDTFAHFCAKYVQQDKVKIETNKEDMKKP